MVTIALRGSAETLDAAKAHLAGNTPPEGIVVVRLEAEASSVTLDRPVVELGSDAIAWLFALLDAGKFTVDDDVLAQAHRDHRARKPKSWFASLMASFGI